MSRNPDDYTDERRTAVALERIADTLDDYMDMSLAGIEATNGIRAADPEIDAALRPLIDVLSAIRERRALR